MRVGAVMEVGFEFEGCEVELADGVGVERARRPSRADGETSGFRDSVG